MTMHDQRFDRALPGLFVELASASTPDYLEAAIERASSRPQRPAWTYPGRWLPVDITTQAAPAARMPWRQLGILALIGLLLAVAAVAYRRRPARPLPCPAVRPRRGRRHRNGTRRRHRDRGSRDGRGHPARSPAPRSTARRPTFATARGSPSNGASRYERPAHDHGRQRRRHRPLRGDPGAARRPPVRGASRPTAATCW